MRGQKKKDLLTCRWDLVAALNVGQYCQLVRGGGTGLGYSVRACQHSGGDPELEARNFHSNSDRPENIKIAQTVYIETLGEDIWHGMRLFLRE